MAAFTQAAGRACTLRYRLEADCSLDVSSARAAVAEYLRARGYRGYSAGSDAISMRRGSWLGNLCSLSPRGWISCVSGSVSSSAEGSLVALEWSVETRFQLGTRGDRAFWTAEFEGLRRALSEDGAGPAPDGRMVAVWNAIRAGVMVLPAALGLGLPTVMGRLVWWAAVLGVFGSLALTLVFRARLAAAE